MCKICNKELIKFLEDKPPDYWHQLAWNWNFDGGIEPLAWIINKPQCDKGTVLLIYWSIVPSLGDYKNIDEVDKHQKDAFSLIQDIQSKYIEGFYKNEKITFDPRDDRGINWEKDYNETKKRIEIPKDMYTATKGKKIQWIDIPEGIPDEVFEKTEKYH